MRAAASIVIAVVFLAVLALVLFGRTYRIPSESMEPTVEINDRVLALKVGDPGVGDIVIHNPPVEADSGECAEPPPSGAMCAAPSRDRGNVTFIKRVVAEGGDRIALRRGRVIRNGRPVDEPFGCREGGTCDFPREITVPRGHLFVLGDNRGASDDSRFWGPVPEDWVRGRVVARYWPPSRVGGL